MTCFLFCSLNLRRKSWEVWGDTVEGETWKGKDLLHAAWLHLLFSSTLLACPAQRSDNIIHIFLSKEDTPTTLIFSFTTLKSSAVDPLTKFWHTWMRCPCFILHTSLTWYSVTFFFFNKDNTRRKGKSQTYLRVQKHRTEIHETSWD